MTRARCVAGLGWLLAAPGLAGATEPAVATTVVLSTPERAVVRTRIPPGSGLAEVVGFHGLGGDPIRGWRRTPLAFESDPAGGLVLAGGVSAGPDGWFRVVIPIPESPPPGTDLSFAAEISPPAGHRIVDAFPAGTAAGDGSGTLRLALPAPPSLLRFRVAPVGERRIGLAAVVDGAVALVLAALAGFGVHRLRRPPTRDPDEPA